MKSRIWIVCAMLLALSGAAPASAQLFEYTSGGDTTLRVEPGDSAAYDPVHDLYFIVTAPFSSGIAGRFVNRAGIKVGSVLISSEGGALTRVVYSPDVSNGSGGTGGFLVIWRGASVDQVFGQVVSWPAGLVGPMTTVPVTGLSAVATGGEWVWVNQIGLAYSPIDRVFLAALGGIIDLSYESARIVRLNLAAQPIGETSLTTTPASACFNIEFPFSCNKTDVVWNPVSGEFGVAYSQGKQRVLARMSGSGVVLGRTLLDVGPSYGALAVNRDTGNYLVVGAQGDGHVTYGSEVSPTGSIVRQGVVTSALDTQMAVLAIMDLSYSATSGTFLLSGRVFQGFAAATLLLELDQHGSPLGSPLSILPPYVAIAPHAFAAEWAVAGDGAVHIIRSSTRLAACATPDPFVVLGGGTCFQGGWLPPGIAPRPTTAACQTPDPFVALGGGHCVDGGWLPPDVPIVTPPPPPSPQPGGCLTPDPFVALGGGRCMNGGWTPPIVVLPPPPAGCTTPDPFVAIGGGVCVDGGWRPRG